jgi:hypothetical protein
MSQTNLKLLVETAELRVERAQRHLDRQREAVAALERAGQDATTATRLLKISEQALATHAADRDQLTNGGRPKARREVIRHRQDYGTPEPKSDSPTYQPTGRKTALAAVLGTGQPFQALQQSCNGSLMPFAAQCGRYLSRVQLARDSLGRDNACRPEFENRRAQGFGSHIRGALVCQSGAGRTHAQTLRHPHYGGVMPSTATDRWYS